MAAVETIVKWKRMFRKVIVRSLLAGLLSVVCSGCITAACLAIAAVGVTAAAASAGSSKQAAAARTFYLVSKVDSGIVPGGLQLRRRYCITESKVYRSSRASHCEDAYLDSLADSGSGTVQRYLEAMYPGVFFSGSESSLVVVDLLIDKVYGDKDSGGTDCLVAHVTVRDAASGRQLGCEGFREERGHWPEQTVVDDQLTGSYQTYRSSDDVGTDGRTALRNAIFEGYAGAIAAALEKSENDGARIASVGVGARFVEVSLPVQNSERVVAEDTTADNTAAAVNFFMGSMGAINSMNQSHSRRTSSRQLTPASAVNPGVAAVSSSGASPIPKSCAACFGSGNCRACHGSGQNSGAALVASTTTSPMRSVLAERNLTCKACGGSGRCRGCGGSGHR